MAKARTILQKNKLIYAFMKGKWKAIGDIRGMSHSSFDKKFYSEASCQKFCDHVNKHRDKTKHYSPQPAFYSVIHRQGFSYHLSFDKLIPAIRRFNDLHITHQRTRSEWQKASSKYAKEWVELCDETDHLLTLYNIKPIFNNLVKSIEWFNKNN